MDSIDPEKSKLGSPGTKTVRLIRTDTYLPYSLFYPQHLKQCLHRINSH